MQEKENSQENPQSLNRFGDKNRYITAIVLLGILSLTLYFHQTLIIWATLGILFILSFKEALILFRLKQSLLLYAGAVLTWILAYLNSSPILSGVFFAMLLASFLAYKRSIEPKVILPFFYPTLPFLTLYALYTKMGAYGINCLVWLIVTIAVIDTGAYFGGKIFGRTPLSPTSPSKTLEGAGIGLALGIIVGSILGIGPSGSFVSSLLISIGVAVAAIFGDLFESYLKREANLKDSGTILPGHGGILDRIDAILFGAIAMYYLLGFLPMWQQL